MQGGAFADHVAVADFQPGGLAGVFLILRIFADRGELVDTVISYNFV